MALVCLFFYHVICFPLALVSSLFRDTRIIFYCVQPGLLSTATLTVRSCIDVTVQLILDVLSRCISKCYEQREVKM